MRELHGSGRLKQWTALGLASVLLVACGAEGADDSNGSAPDDGGEESGDAGPEFEWDMAAFLSAESAQGQAMEWWMDEIEERSDGRIQFNRFYNESLVAGADTRDALNDGRVQIANLTTAFTAGDFPLTEVGELPFVGDNVPAQLTTLNQMYAENDAFQEEWRSQGIHVISFIAISPPVTGAAEPIESADWFEGKSVRTSASMTQIVDLLGGDPMTVIAGEAYEAMERGMVDAYTSVMLDLVPDLSLHEVGPHMADVGVGYFGTSTWGLSLEEWEQLPDDLQEMITELTDEFVERQVEIRNEVEDAACETVLDAGGTVTILGDAEVETIRETVEDVFFEQWSAEASAAGVEADEYHEQYVGLIEEHSATFADYEHALLRCAEMQG
jgi:TRAP-type transport system periplasmic protein